MTSLVSHPLPVLAMGLVLGSRVIPPRLLLAGLLDSGACRGGLPPLGLAALGIGWCNATAHEKARIQRAFA